jgi:hypothetical protein
MPICIQPTPVLTLRAARDLRSVRDQFLSPKRPEAYGTNVAARFKHFLELVNEEMACHCSVVECFTVKLGCWPDEQSTDESHCDRQDSSHVKTKR